VLFGREAELTGLTRLLTAERLVTIVGPGGVGKTRLALELAQRSRRTAEVYVVELAPVTDPAAVPDVLARALGVESGAGDPMARCVLHLRHGGRLLVLDNCEHVLDAVRQLVTTLLHSCPELTVLATSRERLSVASEQTSVLAPLPMPGARDTDRMESVPSVALFLARARRVRSDFTPDPAQLATLARLVRALDGLPLAIELAAGRVSSLGLDDLEARLDRALDLLRLPAVDNSGRHHTLRAAIEWSYDLLPPSHRRLFRHLAVFPGGFDLATAEQLSRHLDPSEDSTTMLTRLVDCSMVIAELEGAPRYRMLDTLRAFGLDRLAASGELEDARTYMLRWAVALAAELDAAYETEQEPFADRRLRIELANLRAAWRLSRETGDLATSASLAVDLYAHASWRELTELFRWSLELAEDPALVGHPSEACVLGAAAEAAWSSAGDLDRAERYARRGADAVRPGDARGHALANWALADVHLFLGRYEEAGDLAIEARERTRWIAEGYAQAAIAAAYAGDLTRARAMADDARARIGGPTLRAYVCYIDGEIANLEGDFGTAETHYRESIGQARAVGATFIAGIASVGLVSAQAAAGDTADALTGYRDLLDLWERTGAWTQQWTTIRNLASLLERLDEGEIARHLRSAADQAPEAPSEGGAERTTMTDPARAAEHRATALVLARGAIDRCRQALRLGTS
jgi:predicted ATPase